MLGNKTPGGGMMYKRLPVIFDASLIIIVSATLVFSFFFHGEIALEIMASVSIVGVVPVLYSALRSLAHRRLSIDLLASVALIFSIISTEWFSAAFITLMLAFARLFDQWTAVRTKNIISHLLKFRPERIKVLHGDTAVEKHISEVRVGDLVIVESGERIPVDGKIIRGSAAINQSSLTGESELVQKTVGDEIFTSVLNESGSLVVEAKRVGADTTLEKIILMIEEASRKRSPTERVADRFTQFYILATFIGSIVLFFSGFSPSLILSILLVVCADDIAVAVPLGFTSAISRAARNGVVIKGSDALEKFSHVDYFITDKTGTLTYGRPLIKNIHSFGSFSTEKVIEKLAVGASASDHSVSHAITAEAKKRGLLYTHTPDEFNETPGLGMEFSHDGEKMLSGRIEFLKEKGVAVSHKELELMNSERDLGRAVTLLSVNGVLAGFVSHADELKSDARTVIQKTKDLGVKEWHMITGDNERVAKAVASEVGIKYFHSNLSPSDKVHFVENFKKTKKGIVAMAGDGVNDAASLALVDVSVAMGKVGTDAAIEAADITIMHDSLKKIPETMELSRRMMRIVHENFFIWAITNATGLALVFLGFIGPAGAATYNFLTDFLPIGNALKILKK